MPCDRVVRILFDILLISRGRFGPLLRQVMSLRLTRQSFLRLRRKMRGSRWKRVDGIHHNAPLPLRVAFPDAREVALLRLRSAQLVTAIGVAQITGARNISLDRLAAERHGLLGQPTP